MQQAIEGIKPHTRMNADDGFRLAHFRCRRRCFSVGTTLQRSDHRKGNTMSIFGTIASAIFGHSSASGATKTAGTPAVPPSSSAPSVAAKPLSRAEVEAMIEKIADGQNEELEW